MVVLNEMSRYHLALEALRRARVGAGRGGASWKRTAGRCSSATTPTSASTSRTCPRSATGPGARPRTERVANAGPDPHRQRGLLEPEAAAARAATTRCSAGERRRAARRRRRSWARSCGGCSTRGPAPDAAAHRVVHGGAEFDRPTLVDAGVERELDAARRPGAAPQPAGGAGDAGAAPRCVPELPNVACFDTAFHAGLPAAARTYALPAAWSEGSVPLRRYGFHGLSHAYASRRAAELLGAAPARAAAGHRPPRRGRLAGRRAQAGARSTRRWASPRSTAW